MNYKRKRSLMEDLLDHGVALVSVLYKDQGNSRVGHIYIGYDFG